MTQINRGGFKQHILLLELLRANSAFIQRHNAVRLGSCAAVFEGGKKPHRDYNSRKESAFTQLASLESAESRPQLLYCEPPLLCMESTALDACLSAPSGGNYKEQRFFATFWGSRETHRAVVPDACCLPAAVVSAWVALVELEAVVFIPAHVEQ